MLRISQEELEARARLAAASDHQFDESVLPVQLCRIERVEFFDRIYSDTPEDIGEIEVTYSRNGYRAIYGFTATGEMTCYVD